MGGKGKTQHKGPAEFLGREISSIINIVKVELIKDRQSLPHKLDFGVELELVKIQYGFCSYKAWKQATSSPLDLSASRSSNSDLDFQLHCSMVWAWA